MLLRRWLHKNRNLISGQKFRWVGKISYLLTIFEISKTVHILNNKAKTQSQSFTTWNILKMVWANWLLLKTVDFIHFFSIFVLYIFTFFFLTITLIIKWNHFEPGGKNLFASVKPNVLIILILFFNTYLSLFDKTCQNQPQNGFLFNESEVSVKKKQTTLSTPPPQKMLLKMTKPSSGHVIPVWPVSGTTCVYPLKLKFLEFHVFLTIQDHLNKVSYFHGFREELRNVTW